MTQGNDKCFVPPWNRSGAPDNEPEAENTVAQKLDVVIGLLERLYNRLVPQGINDYFEGSVDANGLEIKPTLPNEMWYSVYIKNTGENDLYFRTNGLSPLLTPNASTPYLTPGNTFAFNPGRDVIHTIYLYSFKETSYRIFCAK